MSGQFLAAIVSVALASAPVPAQPAPAAAPASDEDAKLKRAEELFNNGRQLFKEGSYEAAILAFQESYELSKLPEILYNIGNSYEKLGDFANARKYLDQYRAFAPEKERELLTRRIQNLDQRLREQEEKARLEREKQQAEVKPQEPDPNLVQPQPEPLPPQEPPKKDRVFGPAAGVLTGVAVVGLGLGIGFGVSAQKQRDEALKSCSGAPGGATFCLDEAQPALDRQRSRAIGADVSFIVAGAATVGLLAVIIAKVVKKNRAEQRASVAPSFGPRGAGVSLGLRF